MTMTTFQITSTNPDGRQQVELIPSEHIDFAMMAHFCALNEDMIQSFTVTKQQQS